MKTTSVKCFKSPIELACWQEKNCQLCKKSVWYNERLHRMPKYKCAVQKQVELQCAGELDEVNERTYNAVQGDVCPFLASIDNAPQETVLDFSKGESIVSVIPASEPPKEKTIPSPVDIMPRHLTIPDAEERFQQEVEKSTRMLLDNLTFEEQMQVAFTPLVIHEIIFIYAEKARTYAITNGMDKFKKTSRELQQIRKDYIKEIRKDLDGAHVKKITDNTNVFMEECARDLQIMFFSVNAEIKKRYYDKGDDELYTYICIALLFVRFMYRYVDKMNLLVYKKCKKEDNAEINPYICKLARTLEDYVQNVRVQENGNVKTCFQIFEKNLDSIKYELI